MKIAILNPSFGENFVRVARWAAKSRGRVQRHPDYLLTAAQVLLDAGHEVIFVEAAARNLSPEESLRIVGDFRPDLLVIHATTPSIYNDIDQARAIKEATGCKIAFVGQHVSAEPEDTFEISKGHKTPDTRRPSAPCSDPRVSGVMCPVSETPSLDYILPGEYDHTLRDLASAMATKDVLGLIWYDGEKVIRNAIRPPLDVNELPFPAWHLIKPEWYPDAGKKFPFLTLFTGRGCNNACTFCRDPQLMYGYRLRQRSAKLVVDEMEYDLKLFPQIREIMFETDTFTADPNHVRAVCEEIIRRGLHKKISWSCNVRINVDLDLLPIMKKANCRMLMVGYEFGTDESLRAVRKGGVSVEMGKRFSQRAHELGFTLHGCFMIGAPGETRASARATIDYAKGMPLDTIQITGIATYPGTHLYKWAKDNGYLLAKDWTDWLTAEGEQKTMLSYPQLSNREIDEFIDTGLKEFYLRPKQMWRMLIAIRSFGDFLRKVYGFGAFVDYFWKKITKKGKVTRDMGQG
ncbi:MAG: radical SAM protein [Elusimicrobia bacterium]|nr:radical SAM protein [Elusimicrobiota bacterium]